MARLALAFGVAHNTPFNELSSPPAVRRQRCTRQRVW